MLHRSWSEAEKEAEEDDEGRRRIYPPQKANMQTRGIGPMSNERKSYRTSVGPSCQFGAGFE